MPLERDALLLAMRQFGANFDRDAWQAAYEAFSAEEHNRVVQVTGNLRALVDSAVELVRIAADGHPELAATKTACAFGNGEPRPVVPATSQLLDRRPCSPRSGASSGLRSSVSTDSASETRRDIGHANALAIRSTVP